MAPFRFVYCFLSYVLRYPRFEDFLMPTHQRQTIQPHRQQPLSLHEYVYEMAKAAFLALLFFFFDSSLCVHCLEYFRFVIQTGLHKSDGSFIQSLKA